MDNMNNDLIYGKNSVLEALKANSRRINKILLSKNLHNDPKIDEIIELAKKSKIVFQFVPKEKFNDYREYTHQGVIAFVSPVEYADLDAFLKIAPKNAKIIALDGVQDPHNFGSFIRTAVCAGFDAVMISQRKNSPITPTVEKTSAGAVNLIPVISVNSLSSALEKLKRHAYWIIASDAKGKDNYFNIDYTNMNIALVVGGEDSGVSKTILNLADFTVKIPMNNEFNSLNVSNAAAILMYEVVKQYSIKPKKIV